MADAAAYLIGQAVVTKFNKPNKKTTLWLPFKIIYFFQGYKNQKLQRNSALTVWEI